MKALLAALLASVSSAALASPSIQFIASSENGNHSGYGNVQIPVPAGTQNGDLMLAYMPNEATSCSTPQTGWTLVKQVTNSIQSACLYSRVASNEPASYTWTGAAYPDGIIRTYRNAASVDASSGAVSTNAASLTLPALASPSKSGEVEVVFGDYNPEGSTVTGPAGTANIFTESVYRSMYAGDIALGSSAPAATLKGSAGSSYWDGIAVSIAPASSTTPPPPPPPPPPPTGTAGNAKTANAFMNSLGINIGVRESTTPAQYAAMINYIGVKNVRGSSASGNSPAFAISLAKATNTKFIYWLESGWSGSTSGLTNIEVANARQMANAGVLLALEGPNETDNWCVTYNGVVGGGNGQCNSAGWKIVANLQRDWYAAVKADSVVKNYPMFSSTHTGGEMDDAGLQWIKIPAGAGAELSDGTTFADYAASHNYVIWSGAGAPNDNAAWSAASPTQDNTEPGARELMYADFIRAWRGGYPGYTVAQAPAVPRVSTETGWVSSNGGVDNQGKVLVNVYLAQFKQGWAYTFLYQLKDNEGGYANTFGVFDGNNNPKLGATYIHNLTTILNDTANFTPGTLNYSIPGEPATVHDLLLQKGSGAFELVVWDERPVGEKSDGVTVNLGGSHKTVNIYDPTVGTAITKTLSNVSSVALTLTDHPLIVEVVN